MLDNDYKYQCHQYIIDSYQEERDDYIMRCLFERPVMSQVDDYFKSIDRASWQLLIVLHKMHVRPE